MLNYQIPQTLYGALDIVFKNSFVYRGWRGGEKMMSDLYWIMSPVNFCGIGKQC